MTRMTLTAVVLTLLAPVALLGQHQPPGGAPAHAEHGFAKFLFPPELVMQHQAAIGLRPEQRSAITRAIRDLQVKVVDLHWQVQDETQRLSELIDRPTVDQTAALAQVDKVLAVEREVKRAHLEMLIQIKNLLTPDQQSKLATARGRAGES